MSNVAVSGLPPNITCSAISLCFSNILTKISVRKFWVRELFYNRGVKQASIEFVSHYEASKAKDRLNKLLFDFNGQKYPLIAHVEEKHTHQLARRQRRPLLNSSRETYGSCEGNPLQYCDDERRHTKPSYSERDHSPVYYSDTSSKLDLEIEMLRKQRLVIEEERRLLVESKKLEFVREYGSSAVKELSYIDQRGRELGYGEPNETRRPEKRPYKPPQGSTLRHHPYRQPAHAPLEKRAYQTLARPPPHLKNGYFTPLFVLPCKILLKSMADRLSFGTNAHEAKNLWRQVHATLRKRIAVALEGKPRMATGEIVRLYRQLYPERTDDNMVERLLKRMREDTAIEESETGMHELIEEALSDPGHSATDVKSAPEQTFTELSDVSAEGNQDLTTDHEANLTECELSLDATEIESLNAGSDWSKGHDWWSDDAKQGFVE